MINVRNLGVLIFLLAAVISCDTDEKSNNSKESVEKSSKAIPDSMLVDVDFRVNGSFYGAAVPKGAYVDDQHGVYAYIYLEPGEDNRLIISPDNSENSGLKENKNGFQYFGDGIVCMYATDSMDHAAQKFIQIAQSIKPKSED